ncbi:MAG: DNA-processing protein DprA [Actinomycetota bacterium]|nr:DNA-processing protein DprA [Actinomycetota bacterium]
MNGRTTPEWFDPEDDRTARAAWSRLAEPGDVAVVRCLRLLRPGHALLALMERSERLGTVLRDPRPVANWRARLSQVDPGRDLATMRRFGGRLVVPGDDEWPTGMALLGDREPVALWARGPVSLGVTTRRAVAIVGCRASSRYGEWTAAELASGCVERGITVVSGAAYGIDAAAHRGALAVHGPTVAVLACGVDRPYPRGNEELIEQIAARGTLVSELPPGSSPTRWRFITRNRLIAALGLATVVVEAAWRSGASITAREAALIGRDVAAVPGPVTSSTSAGCHRLLREGAVCVTDAAEIAELLSAVGEHPAPAPSVPVAEHDGLDEVDLRVLDALPVNTAVGVERLTATAGLDQALLLGSLARLEIAGRAARVGTRWRRVPFRRPDTLLDTPLRRSPRGRSTDRR